MVRDRAPKPMHNFLNSSRYKPELCTGSYLLTTVYSFQFRDRCRLQMHVLACSRIYQCVTRSHVVRMFLVGTRMYPCVTRMLPVRYPHVPVWCFSLRFVSWNCSTFGLGLNLPNVRSSKTGLNSYPDSGFLLPWVPEFFHACGGNFRCWPKADTSSAEAA